MENQQLPPESQSLDNFFNIAFDASLRAQIRQAAVWAKICTLSAFIGYGIALVVAFFGQYSPEIEAMEGNFVRTTSVVSALVTTAFGTLINYFLYRFAVATIRGMDSMDNVKANQGFNSLRIYFKICGILLIIVLSLGALAFLLAIIGGLGRGY